MTMRREIEKHHAEAWKRQIIQAGGDENVAQQAIALAALNGLFDIHKDWGMLMALAEDRAYSSELLGIAVRNLVAAGVGENMAAEPKDPQSVVD